MECVVPGKIYTNPMEGHWNFLSEGVEGGGGVQNKKTFGGGEIFSGTAQC